jgi:hypothetical protein
MAVFGVPFQVPRLESDASGLPRPNTGKVAGAPPLAILNR